MVGFGCFDLSSEPLISFPNKSSSSIPPSPSSLSHSFSFYKTWSTYSVLKDTMNKSLFISITPCLCIFCWFPTIYSYSNHSKETCKHGLLVYFHQNTKSRSHMSRGHLVTPFRETSSSLNTNLCHYSCRLDIAICPFQILREAITTSSCWQKYDTLLITKLSTFLFGGNLTKEIISIHLFQLTMPILIKQILHDSLMDHLNGKDTAFIKFSP